MKLIATALIAAMASLSLLAAAEAAPRKLPIFVPHNSSLHLVSIRHNHIKLQVPLQVRRGN